MRWTHISCANRPCPSHAVSKLHFDLVLYERLNQRLSPRLTKGVIKAWEKGCLQHHPPHSVCSLQAPSLPEALHSPFPWTCSSPNARGLTYLIESLESHWKFFKVPPKEVCLRKGFNGTPTFRLLRGTGTTLVFIQTKTLGVHRKESSSFGVLRAFTPHWCLGRSDGPLGSHPSCIPLWMRNNSLSWLFCEWWTRLFLWQPHYHILILKDCVYRGIFWLLQLVPCARHRHFSPTSSSEVFLRRKNKGGWEGWAARVSSI